MVTIIHNLYKRNPHVRESVYLNLQALRQANVKFQYICFNDNGDPYIKEDLKDLLNQIEYFYSNHNFGKGMCSGGWVGAIPLIKGNYIHNTGQDDVFTPNFYKQLITCLDNEPDVSLVYANAIATDEALNAQKVMLTCSPQPIYYFSPFEAFKVWFGVGENGPTCANNNFPAPGVIYRRNLHDQIGIPDLENFLGSADFEYWSRILFYGHKCKYFNLPLWLYRVSNFSTSNTTPECDKKTQEWNIKILQKYKQLYFNR